MKLSLICIALAASVASAENCQSGLKYCAFTLLGKGAYLGQTNDALTAFSDAGPDLGSYNPNYFLFQCGTAGAVTAIQRCSAQCVDGGSNNNDYCPS